MSHPATTVAVGLTEEALPAEVTNLCGISKNPRLQVIECTAIPWPQCLGVDGWPWWCPLLDTNLCLWLAYGMLAAVCTRRELQCVVYDNASASAAHCSLHQGGNYPCWDLGSHISTTMKIDMKRLMHIGFQARYFTRVARTTVHCSPSLLTKGALRDMGASFCLSSDKRDRQGGAAAKAPGGQWMTQRGLWMGQTGRSCGKPREDKVSHQRCPWP